MLSSPVSSPWPSIRAPTMASTGSSPMGAVWYARPSVTTSPTLSFTDPPPSFPSSLSAAGSAVITAVAPFATCDTPLSFAFLRPRPHMLRSTTNRIVAKNMPTRIASAVVSPKVPTFMAYVALTVWLSMGTSLLFYVPITVPTLSGSIHQPVSAHPNSSTLRWYRGHGGKNGRQQRLQIPWSSSPYPKYVDKTWVLLWLSPRLLLQGGRFRDEIAMTADHLFSEAARRRRASPDSPESRGPRARKRILRKLAVRRRWTRILAYALILLGLAILAYPAATWLMTMRYQNSLQEELAAADPVLSADMEFDLSRNPEKNLHISEDGASYQSETEGLRSRAVSAEREQALRDSARDFARSVSGNMGAALGRLEIPEIGLDVIMVEGTTTGALRRGPGHWSETPMPGLGGNFVISGHRTTYGGPFLRLDRLNQGDVIRVALPYVLLEYRVTRKLIVSPDEVNVVAQRGVEELSLTTCHPIYSAKQRLIIQAKMVTLRPLEGDPAGS